MESPLVGKRRPYFLAFGFLLEAGGTLTLPSTPPDDTLLQCGVLQHPAAAQYVLHHALLGRSWPELFLRGLAHDRLPMVHALVVAGVPILHRPNDLAVTRYAPQLRRAPDAACVQCASRYGCSCRVVSRYSCDKIITCSPDMQELKPVSPHRLA